MFSCAYCWDNPCTCSPESQKYHAEAERDERIREEGEKDTRTLRIEIKKLEDRIQILEDEKLKLLLKGIQPCSES